MTPEHDRPSCYIEDTLLLKFLIVRYTEMLEIKQPKLVPVWAGLGMVALHQNKELKNAFKTLISSDSYSSEEVITSSIDLFLAELYRLDAVDTNDYVGKLIERRPMSRRTARKFLFWAWSEGRKMSKEKDFRFYSIWELLSWLGLTSDDYRHDFEENCRFSSLTIEERLQEGLDIIKCAIFRRKRDRNNPFSVIEHFQKQGSRKSE